MSNKTYEDADLGLDRITPQTHTARDATQFRRIIAARKRIAGAEAELRAAVAAAHQAGDSWAVIGMALDTSRQAAYQRFGSSPGATASADDLTDAAKISELVVVPFTDEQIVAIRRLAEDAQVDDETYIRDAVMYRVTGVQWAAQADADTGPENSEHAAEDDLSDEASWGQAIQGFLPTVPHV